MSCHLRHRGPAHRPPARLRSHADHRQGGVGPAARPRRGPRRAPAGGRAGRRLHRHRRQLRPHRVRGAHRRGARARTARSASPPRPASPAPGRADWHPVGRPEYLQPAARAQPAAAPGRRRSTSGSSTGSTRRCPARSSSGCSRRRSTAGKVRHVGLSEVSVEEIEAARAVVPIATVQNLYNLANRSSEDVLDHCRPTASGSSRGSRSPPGDLAKPGWAAGHRRRAAPRVRRARSRSHGCSTGPP